MSDEVVRTTQTTPHVDAPIDCSMGPPAPCRTVASTPLLLRAWQRVVGCNVLEIDDVSAAAFADLEDKEYGHVCASVVHCFLKDIRDTPGLTWVEPLS